MIFIVRSARDVPSFCSVLFVLFLFRFRFIIVRKPDNSNSHEFELHRPSNKGTKLLLKVIKAIIIIEKISFPLSSNERISSAPFFDLHHTTHSCIVLDSSSQFFFSCSDRLSHITTVGLSISPQKSRSPRPADSKKGGADIAASPSILVALLICCSACNNAHIGDLYPAWSNSSVRFVSFRTVVISACSWPSQRSCFFRKFHPPLVIVHPRPGSRHVVRPFVVMILVSSTRSSHTCNESWTLTKPPAGISWSRKQFCPITSGVSCSRRGPGSYADVGIEGASHHMLLRMNSEPFLSIGLLTMSG